MNHCKVCDKFTAALVCANCILTDEIRGRAARAIMAYGPRTAIVVDAQTLLTILGPKPEGLGFGERIVVDDVGKPHEVIEQIDLTDVPKEGPKS